MNDVTHSSENGSPKPRRSVYMDANATTQLSPEVYEAMVPYLLNESGNCSSNHRHGRHARAAIESARRQVAYLLHAKDHEVVFTSGGTEANNLAIFGTMTEVGGHIITSSIEHQAVLHAVQWLEQRGHKVTYLPVGESGRIDPEDVRQSLRHDTRLITIMMANNETGVLQPVNEIGRIAREHGVVFHTDAVQAAGKVPIDVHQIKCDLLSISGHKMYGPQGTGALFVHTGVALEPMFRGGSQEFGRRAGTENVAGAVGFGEAALNAKSGLRDVSLNRMMRFRDALEHSLLREIPYSGINGHRADRVPNTTNIWFDGVEGRTLLRVLDALGLSVSGGSACHASSCEPSHVLLAMGLTPGRANSSIRFSLSKQTTAEDVDFAIWQVAEAVTKLRDANVSIPSVR